MLADKTPGRARRMAGAGFIVVTLLGAGLAAWAQKPPVPVFAGATVELSSDGRVLWNGKVVEGKEALAEEARNQVASGAPRIRLSADANIQYFNVGRVIEAAHEQGLVDVTLLPSGALLTTPTRDKKLRLVALKRELLEVRSADGTKYVRRRFEPGESYPPRIGSGWTVSTPDGAAFEWRVGDQSLGLLAETGPVDAQNVDLAARRTPTSPAVVVPDPVRIFVDFDGTLFWNGKAVDMPTIERNLRAAAKQSPQPEIHIEPHRQAMYERVEQVIAAANGIGLNKIGVIGGT